jgi:hypothetical protein
MFPSDPEEGLRFLRYLKGPTSQIPRGAGIVVHTNATAPHYRKLAYEAGADEFLAKGEARQLIDLVDLYSGGEVLVAQTLCRVVDVDLMKGKVAVEIDGADGWVAERAVDLQQCPNEARIAGGAFYLDSYKRFRFYPGSRVLEYSILSRAVDESEEQKKLAYLFSEVDN